MRHSWGTNCFREIIDGGHIFFVFATILLLRWKRIGRLLETTSRNVNNEKTNSLQLNETMCRTRRRLLQKWKAHSRRLMFVYMVECVGSAILQINQKLTKRSKTQFGNVAQLSVPLHLLQQIILTMKWKNYNSFLRFYLLGLDEIVAATVYWKACVKH